MKNYQPSNHCLQFFFLSIRKSKENRNWSWCVCSTIRLFMNCNICIKYWISNRLPFLWSVKLNWIIFSARELELHTDISILLFKFWLTFIFNITISRFSCVIWCDLWYQLAVQNFHTLLNILIWIMLHQTTFIPNGVSLRKKSFENSSSSILSFTWH